MRKHSSIEVSSWNLKGNKAKCLQALTWPGKSALLRFQAELK